MQDARILSTFPKTAPAPAPPPVAVAVFDACHVGVVLRAVLLVEAVAAVAAQFGPGGFWAWLGRLALLTGGILPATLLWLAVGCGLKRPLARLPHAGQYGFGLALGALAGLYGCGVLTLVDALDPAPWLASACAGLLLSALLLSMLALRAKGRAPAATLARLGELQARIRPHFLFNTLNSAIALVRAEPAQAEALLEDLSDLLRHALQEPGESVTLEEEVALARRYLDIEQARFGGRLRLAWRLDPAAGAARLPPLLLQPLVENAVKHGVEPSPEGAEVTISTWRRGGMAVIEVTNTMPAGPGARGQGVALANVRDRLHLLHDAQARFHAASEKNGIYRVRVEVPTA